MENDCIERFNKMFTTQLIFLTTLFTIIFSLEKDFRLHYVLSQNLMLRKIPLEFSLHHRTYYQLTLAFTEEGKDAISVNS